MADEAATSVEVYGFVGWVTSLVAFVLYLLWAFLPNSVLEGLGVTYYPDKHWALTGLPPLRACLAERVLLLVPLLLSMAVVYILTGYEFLNMTAVQSPTERSTIEDTTPQWTLAELQQQERTKRVIPPLKDIPLDHISRELYL